MILKLIRAMEVIGFLDTNNADMTLQRKYSAII